MNWINKIRQKPQAVKTKIMWSVGIAVVVFLLIVWIVAARISKRYSSKELFQDANWQFSIEKSYYQKDLKEKGMVVPDRFNLFH